MTGAVATETPPTTRPVAPASVTAPTPAVVPPEESIRLTKRQREETPPFPSPNSAQQHTSFDLGSPSKAARLALASGTSPPPLTGAAALEDQRRQRVAEQRTASPPASSDNPSSRVLASLVSATAEPMSRPTDAPQGVPMANMDSATSRSVNSLSLPPETNDRVDEPEATTPRSTDDLAGVPVTASPTPMDVDKTDPGLSQQIAGHEERTQLSSLSYPGSLQSAASIGDSPSRGMSYPMPTGPGSLQHSNKKYKCPYCNTEFTRHHNLKSHLLTHSQEKPFVCTECPLRFRRLHDLKRHGKLHTGEKPHICPKCDRKFARGDALARHSKGAGGCAGRRSSMGSFADGDEMDTSAMGEGDDSAMSGIGYDHGDDADELRRQSMPTVTAQHVGGQDAYNVHSRTYPPSLNRPAGGLYPPNVAQTQASSVVSSNTTNGMGSNHTPNTSISSAPLGGSNSGMYSQTGVTESPKPLSPGAPGQDQNAARQRSPAASQQLGRRQSDLQSPHGGQGKPQGLSHPPLAAAATNSTSGYTHARTPSGNDSRNMFAQSDPSVWAYVQTLEEKVKNISEEMDQKVKTMTDQIAFLTEKITTLEKQQGEQQQTEPVPPPAQLPTLDASPVAP